MEEQKSIFSDHFIGLNARVFYSISRWSYFIGIILFVAAATIFVLGLIFRSVTESIFSLAQSTVLSPLFSVMQNMPMPLWVILIIIVFGFLIVLGFLFIQIAKRSRDYFHTQSGHAFIKMMQSMHMLFLIGTLGAALSIVPTLFSIFHIF